MTTIDWAFVQANADNILADGFEALRSRPEHEPRTVDGSFPCNYLILLGKNPLYIGEAQNATARIRQQFREPTSTFYKTYTKRSSGNPCAAIGDFRVRVLPAALGRKELEEFGISHLDNPLNKFQLGKRAKRDFSARTGLWDVVQAHQHQLMDDARADVATAEFLPWFANAAPDAPGLYLVKQQSELIYIGESSGLEGRYLAHSGRTYFSALRRHIGTEILGFNLHVLKGKKRYFSETEDAAVTTFLRDCRIAFCPVSFGRFELEEMLIGELAPRLNRKSMSKAA